MATYESSRSVAASPEAVRRVIDDPSHMTEWHQLIDSVRDVDEDGFDATMSMLGTEMGVETSVGRSEQSVELTHRARKLSVIERFAMTEQGSVTQLDYRIETKGKGLFRVLGRGLVPVLERAVDNGLARIDELATE